MSLTSATDFASILEDGAVLVARSFVTNTIITQTCRHSVFRLNCMHHIHIDLAYCYMLHVCSFHWSVCLCIGHIGGLENCTKMAELIVSHVGPWNYVLNGGHIGANWQIRLNDACIVAKWP